MPRGFGGGDSGCGDTSVASHRKTTVSVPLSKQSRLRIKGRRAQELTSHFTPKPPFVTFLQDPTQHISPRRLFNLLSSLSPASPIPCTLPLSTHSLEPRWASMLRLGSWPGGVEIGVEQRGHGRGVRLGGGEVHGWYVDEEERRKGEWWERQKGRWQPGHWRVERRG